MTDKPEQKSWKDAEREFLDDNEYNNRFEGLKPRCPVCNHEKHPDGIACCQPMGYKQTPCRCVIRSEQTSSLEDQDLTIRVKELFKQFDIPDTDVLKHRLEDHERWSKDVVNLNIELEQAKKERNDFRFRLFHYPNHTGTAHTTACSIWREDGQGHAKGFYGDMGPCNCGALVNFEKQRVTVLREALEKMLGCLVVWRCWSCEYELHETPSNPFGPCPKCGKEGAGHKLFSDDREQLLKTLRAALGKESVV